MRNPPWTRDELILALDLYFTTPAARGSKSHPKVLELSDLLNKLPIHAGSKPGETFRNPNGVGMKLSNFLRYDPDYSGKGLQRGSMLEEEVWNQFANDRQGLHSVAEAIKSNYSTLEESPPTKDDEYPDEMEAAEGRVLTRVHRRRERNSKLVATKKKKALSETGKLICEACGFDFEQTYGSLGKEFAECHHERPVSELKPGEKTKLSDLRIVCANCHRMIHRARPWKTVAEISALVEKV